MKKHATLGDGFVSRNEGERWARTPTLRRAGFTLVELLVVIAIIGMLVGLLLPAVQQAREAARQMQCNNQLRQMGIAALNHEATKKYFPSGGWRAYFEPDPDMGSGAKQPGCWRYSLLPYMEQNAVWELGMDGDQLETTVKAANAQRIQSLVPIYYCPSRRAAKLYYAWCYTTNSNGVSQGTKADYAACIGTSWDSSMTSSSYADGIAKAVSKTIPGVTGCKSEIRVAEIKDGTSNTYLYGEKCMDATLYEPSSSTTFCAGDDHAAWAGIDDDSVRYATQSYIPIQDRAGYAGNGTFGSPHAGSMGFVLCDGSVHRVSYSIDKVVHQYLGTRADGKVANIPD